VFDILRSPQNGVVPQVPQAVDVSAVTMAMVTEQDTLANKDRVICSMGVLFQLRSYLNKKVAAPGLENRRLTAVGTRCADHVTTLYPQKLALTSPTGGCRSVGIVRSRTKATELLWVYF